MNSAQSGAHFPVQHRSLSLDIKVPVFLQQYYQGCRILVRLSEYMMNIFIVGHDSLFLE